MNLCTFYYASFISLMFFFFNFFSYSKLTFSLLFSILLLSFTACRYEKGAWSECTNGQMTRLDKLKTAAAKANLPVNTDATDANSDSSCEPIRKTTKRCNSGGAKMANKANKERKHKDKAQRRAQQEQGQ
ncbi:unnamed protein product [Ceratitis capitata]|uniref:(Mediterranean fruit fly) hypothetical protein n=1 Tax=Ceratitis capitata TaxID=7213 RepID=A0A811UUI8_CERCA|nr:unnamed protein product [Ceratitis capitata]